MDVGGHPPTVALWFYSSDADQWRLLLGSPELDKLEPTAAYKLIAEILTNQKDTSVQISDTKVVKTSEPLVAALRAMIKTGDSPMVANVRLTSNYFNGVFIPDALLYRSGSA